MIYVLDEPSIGLHQRDNNRLIETLKALRDLGNTLIVVEHDETTIREADYVVDLGPGAGNHGGYVTAQGTPQEIEDNPKSLTGQYLKGTLFMETPTQRRAGNGNSLKLYGVNKNNLKDIDVEIPLGKMVVITGVSGSGKSTLLNEVLIPALKRILEKKREKFDGYRELTGGEFIDKVINIDQSPIGRTLGPTQPPMWGPLPPLGNSLPPYPNRKPGVINRGGSLSMSLEDAVKTAKGTGS